MDEVIEGGPVAGSMPSDKTMRWLLDGKIPFVCPLSRVQIERSILNGRYNHYPLPTRVRRILDIGAGVGAFALWAWKKWAPVWIDAWEPDEVLRTYLWENAPPGTRIVDIAPGHDMEPYDIVRSTVRWPHLMSRTSERVIPIIEDRYLA